jgi:hypothetical protein
MYLLRAGGDGYSKSGRGTKPPIISLRQEAGDFAKGAARSRRVSWPELSASRKYGSRCSARILRALLYVRNRGDSDVFSVNADFKSKFTKIKVKTVTAAKETPEEAQKTRSKVDDDRKPLVRRVQQCSRTTTHFGCRICARA